MTIDDFLREELADPETGFSIGVNGAIAEFFRDASEPAAHFQAGTYTVCTARGAMRIAPSGDVHPVAIEIPSRSPDFWQQRVALCLDDDEAAMPARVTIADLGADSDAVRAPDRRKLRFDLGLGIPHVDACIRTDDEALIALMRSTCGRNLLKDASDVIAAIVVKSPQRVFVSRLGRIEVFSRIPVDSTVLGPHTHLLPKLLGVPEGGAPWIGSGRRSCLDVYPAHPARRETGGARPFDAARHARFQRVLSAWGVPAYLNEKRQTELWLRQGRTPDACPPASDETARAGRRVVLRQLACMRPDHALLAAWRTALEDGGSGRSR